VIATTHPKRQNILLAALAVLALSASLLAGTTPAHAATPAGTITGQVSLGVAGSYAGAGDVVVTLSKYVGSSPAPLPGVSATTDATGTYTIEGLEHARYDVHFAYVGSGPYMPTTSPYSALFPATVFNTTIPYAYVVAGRVSLDTEGIYAGAGEVRVTASSGGVSYTGMTDADGRYDLGRVWARSGGWELRFEHLSDESYPDWYYTGDSRGAAQTSYRLSPLADRTDYDVVVGAGASLSGTLVDSSGDPVEGAIVVLLELQPGYGGPRIHANTVTDAEGDYRFRALPNDRTYSIVWGQDDSQPYAVGGWPSSSFLNYGALPITPDTDEHISGLDGTLYLASAVDVFVTWPSSLNAAMDGPGQAHVRLEMYDPTENSWTVPSTIGALSSTEHFAWLDGLAPGRYRVSVAYLWSQPPFLTTWSPEFDLGEYEIAEIDLELSPHSGPIAPTVDVAPSVSGDASMGSTWMLDPGVWTGYPEPTIVQAWLRCSQPVSGDVSAVPPQCIAIPGARGTSYVSTIADAGKYITAQVAGINSGGATNIVAPTTVITAGPIVPEVTTAPTVSGNASAGSTWTLNQGSWTGNPTRIVQAWLRCSSPVTVATPTIPAGCVAITGARGITYLSTAADAGKYITAQVAAINTAGTTNTVALTTVATTGPVIPAASVAPTVTGDAAVGSTWTLDTGTWTGNPTRIVQAWLRCSSPVTVATPTIPAGCVAITGARGITYLSTAADAGKYITAQVAAINTAGTTNTVALTTVATTGPVIPAASVAPTVTGDAAVGSTWTLDTGTWTGNPTRIVQAWLRCSSPVTVATPTIPAGCVAITGARGLTYVSTAADAGKYLTAQVAGINTAGTTNTVALTTVATTGPTAPTVTVAPTVTGDATVGSTWTLDTGTWTGTPTPVIIQAWLRCTTPITTTYSAVPAGCVAITGARSLTYVSTAADSGKYITAQVAARNTAGTTNTVAHTTLTTTG
jgi:hypothetical protein